MCRSPYCPSVGHIDASRAATVVLVSDPYYLPTTLSARDSGTGTFGSTGSTVGPWAPQLQHGGPPNALLVACAERGLAVESGRTDLAARRLAAEFIGPVPVAELETRVRVLRVARSAALVEVVLASGGRECLHGRVWFVRDADTSAVATPAVPPPWPVPERGAPLETLFGFGASVDWCFVEGRMQVPGPAAAWVRARTPLLDGYELSGLARAVLVADSGNGISAELDWSRWTFVNVDLDVHIARPVEGEWVLMQARTQLSPHGSALARSVLSDERGELGAGLQTLVVAQPN